MSVCLTAIKTDTQAPENAENTLRLMPRVHPRIQRFLQQQALLFNLIDGVGSPLNLMFPQNMADNVESFQEAYKRHHLRGRIYFTSKPCKSSALMRQASLAPIHIDVSSTRSMKEAIGCGFSPDRLEATGPKNPEYILTALQLDVLLNVDNFEELKLIAALHKKLDLKRKARIFIRLGGFSSSTIHMTPQDDVFGIQVKDGPLILDWLVAHQDIVDFQGFSFHLSSRDSNLPRLIAIENMLELTFAAIKRGLKPKGINIGGGYSVQYAETAQGWLDYNDALKDSVMGNIPSQTWNNSGLGYRDANGVLAGGPHFMNHYSPLVKGDQLSDLLSQRLTKFKNATIASIIGDSLLELYIEPGRGMLDQCGITLARVNFSKKSVWDENLTFADINQTNLRSMHHKNLTESFVIYRNPRRNLANDTGLFYIGNLCVSFDILQYNKQYPQLLPQAGDVICFMNTAPYAMDFKESETLMQPTAKKVALWEDGKESWRWAMDDKYMPINFSELEI